MFMGALLLLAAVLTWSIGLMMSPHGDTVAKGTEYLRSTVVIFKRNSAIGTLLLCALGAWLLFPSRRPKWPARDWALIAVFTFLAGSSLYTLIWLERAVPNTGNVEENLANTNVDSNAGSLEMNAAAMNMPPVADFNQQAALAAVNMKPVETRDRSRVAEQQQPATAVTALDERSPEAPDEPANNETEANQE